MIIANRIIVTIMTVKGEIPGLSHESPGIKIGSVPRVEGPGMYEGLDISLKWKNFLASKL